MSLARRILRLPRERPVAFGMGFSALKTSFSDFLVQKFLEQRDEIDMKRNMSFFSFGLFYLGGVQYFIYVPLFGKMFPRCAEYAAKPLREKVKDVRGTSELIAQVFLDQCVHHPLLYFPTFYITKELINGGTAKQGMDRYIVNAKEDCFALWKIWVPSTLINFAFSPMWLRIPFVASTSLVWTCILSSMRGSSEADLDGRLASDSTGNQGRALETRLRSKWKAANPDNTEVVVSVSGTDRAGVVRDLTGIVVSNHGNILDSQMIRFRSQFCIMMAVSADEKDLPVLLEKIHGFKGDVQVNTDVETLKRTPSKGMVKRMKFILHAQDTPGLIHSVADCLSARGVLFNQLQSTHIASSSDVFCLEADILVPSDMEDNQLQAELEGLRQDLKDYGVECTVQADTGNSAAEQFALQRTTSRGYMQLKSN